MNKHSLKSNLNVQMMGMTILNSSSGQLGDMIKNPQNVTTKSPFKAQASQVKASTPS